MYNNTKQYETHNKSVQQSATKSKLKHKDTRKDYALELEFLGNAVLYKICGSYKCVCVCVCVSVCVSVCVHACGR